MLMMLIVDNSKLCETVSIAFKVVTDRRRSVLSLLNLALTLVIYAYY